MKKIFLPITLSIFLLSCSDIKNEGSTDEKFVGMWQIYSTKLPKMEDFAYGISDFAKREIYSLEKMPNTKEAYIFRFNYDPYNDPLYTSLWHGIEVFRKIDENSLRGEDVFWSPKITLSNKLSYVEATKHIVMTQEWTNNEKIVIEFAKLK